MNKKSIFTPKFIAGVGILTAVEVVLYIVGTFFPIGVTNINLALIPIALGAMFYGPFCGLFLGAVNGVATLLTPGVQAYFMDTKTFGELAILGTILACMLKCSCAGLVSGYIYKSKIKNDIVRVVLASLIVPVVNTGIFLIFAAIFFNYDMQAIINTVFTFNFLIEFLGTAVLSPAIIRIIKVWNMKNAKEEVTSE